MWIRLRIWPVAFAIWASWECAIRLFLFHKDWSISHSLSYIGIHLGVGLIWSLVLGMIHGLLITLAVWSERKWLLSACTPVSAAPVAALLGLPAIFYFRYFAVQHAMSFSTRWIWAIIPVLGAIYWICRIVARFLAGVRVPPWICGVFFFFPIAAFFFGQLLWQTPPAEHAKGPVRYVVLISIDTLRHDYVGAYGAKQVRTPVLDQVAAEGALFLEAISSIPLTGPSHSTMLTGLSPLIHGVRRNGDFLPRRTWTVTRQLRDSGFRTGGFIAGYPLKSILSGLDQGFQRYDERLAFIDAFNETYYGRLAFVLPFFRRGLYRSAKEVTDPAMEWIDQSDGSPFFLFLHYYDPHFPYGAKDRVRDLRYPLKMTASKEDVDNQKRLYAGEVHAVDIQVERIIGLLRGKGIYDQTLLIITSDHGESLEKHDYFYGHGFYTYEQLVRVPMIVRCPLLVGPGIVVPQQVAVLDVYRTILDAVGLRPKPGSGGVSLIELANQAPPGYNRVILSHNFISDVHAARTSQWKFIQNGGNKQKPFELYDLHTDPGETVNLYTTKRDIALSLEQFLAAQLASSAVSRTSHLTPEQIETLKSLGYVQ